jgi:hypothetical protein
MKNKPLLWVLAGILTVALIVSAIFGVSWFFRFGRESTGEHPLANKLNDDISYLPYLKDGNIYYFDGTSSTLVAENAYNAQAEDPVFTANYGIDAKTGKMIYVSNDNTLYLYDGTVKKIAENVTSWRTGGDMTNISFTTKWFNTTESGALFMYSGGNISLVDTGVTVSTVRFSQDGTCLFYEKSNLPPNIRSSLYKYKDGVRTLVHGSSYSVLWVNTDGTRLITGENFDDGLYSYRIFTDDLKKQYEFENVYFSEVSDDQSIAYLLCNYNMDIKSGTLIAVDLSTLKTKEISSIASFFNSSAVTDSSKGVVYSVLTDYESNFYSVFYGDVSGNSIRLIRNTTEESLYNVIINPALKDGYLLSYGATKNNSGIYYISLKKNTVEATRIASGNVDGITYYEENHLVTYIKNPSNGIAQLYRVDKTGENVLITENCGAIYSASSATYQSASVLSSDKKTMYFNNIVTGNTTVDISGTLYVDGKMINENVSASYMEAPVADSTFKNIYYLKQSEKLDLYLYDGTESTLIASNVDGIIELTK